MLESLQIVFFIVIGLGLGLLIGKKLFSANNVSQIQTLEEQLKSAQTQASIYKEQIVQIQKNTEKQIQALDYQLQELRKEKENTSILLSRKETEFENLWERNLQQKKEVEELQQKFTKEFENLANKILEEKSNKFTEQNHQNLKLILSPLQEKIQLFEKKVEDTHKESIDYHAALRQQIIGLTALNEQMSKEAVNLTKALKGDSKMQGNWGELVLERVLEKSGLEKGREYDVQVSQLNEEGNRVLPDVVVHLPDGKKNDY
jgi:DNA recombination protein RmuC